MCNIIFSNLFNIWKSTFFFDFDKTTEIKKFVLNFGPQHPASHGVLRLVLQLENEIILKSDSNIGFLHRGTEKLIEQRTYIQSLPYFDRLDYVSMMSQEHSFCLVIEDLLGTTSYTSLYTQIRVLFDELTRLMNHFLGISTHSLDVGNMSPAFWAFEEREKLMEFYERVSGARMHANFYRPNDLDISGLNYQLFNDITFFLKNTFKSLTEMFVILATNNIWKSRLINVGSLSFIDALKYGASGVVLRSTGFKKDLRLLKSTFYSYYWYLSFSSFLGLIGDCYDRFLIRIREMFESIYIIYQLLPTFLTFFSSNFSFYNFFESINLNNYKKNNYFGKNTSMELLIEHFKYYSEGIKITSGYSYQAIESPKGEFGVSIISNSSSKPFRCKIRSPAFHHLQLMSKMIQGHLFSDMITILGSQDIVFGEVDR